MTALRVGAGHNQAPRVRVLKVFSCPDSGTTEAVSLYLEVDGQGLDVVLREAVPLKQLGDNHLRLALAAAAEALMQLARNGVQE